MIQTIELKGIKLTCEFSYSYTPGCYSTSNGDPGWPESEELVLESIVTNGDIIPLLDLHSRTATIYADIKEKLLIHAREEYKN